MNVISHVSVGTSKTEFGKMVAFYDAVMPEVGAKRQMVVGSSGEKIEKTTQFEDDKFVGIGYGKYFPEFWIQLPNNNKDMTVGNGTHVAFSCKSPEQVKKVYEVAMANGGACNGPPGPRPDYDEHYYAAFFTDPCGNRLEAVFFDMGVLMNNCEIL